MSGKDTGKRHQWRYFLAAGILLALMYLVLCVVMDTEHIPPGTAVDGILLGGMSREEAVKILEEAADTRSSAAVLTMDFEGTKYNADAKEALIFDCEGAAEAALCSVRGPFLLRGLARIRTLAGGADIEWSPQIDTDRLYEAVSASGILEEDQTVQTLYREEDGQLIFTLGTAGNAVDEDGLMELAAIALQTGDTENVISCPVRTGIVEPVDLNSIYQAVHQEMKNAALDPKNDYQIIPSVTGVDFDSEEAQALLDAAEEGSTVAVELIYTEPEITTEDMEEHLFETELATFTTRVTSNENYITNVRLAAQKCDGIILLPGEEFSFNRTVGEQTAETGFKKASAIQGTKLIQAYGGGICQVSSALFVAALYAGLEIPERWNHTYVTSYLDAGLDAAVAWDVLDFKIANDREYPIQLEVRYADRYLTASIWGTKTEDTRVEIETEVLESTDEILRVVTYRKTYSADDEHFFIEKVGNSEYLSPAVRVD